MQKRKYTIVFIDPEVEKTTHSIVRANTGFALLMPLVLICGILAETSKF
jgi:hypothetical protein